MNACIHPHGVYFALIKSFESLNQGKISLSNILLKTKGCEMAIIALRMALIFMPVFKCRASLQSIM